MEPWLQAVASGPGILCLAILVLSLADNRRIFGWAGCIFLFVLSVWAAIRWGQEAPLLYIQMLLAKLQATAQPVTDLSRTVTNSVRDILGHPATPVSSVPVQAPTSIYNDHFYVGWIALAACAVRLVVEIFREKAVPVYRYLFDPRRL
jgi:hypothetical protein